MSETLSASLPAELEGRITRVLETLCDRGLTVATAESCTGGLVASVLTDVQGCAHAFARGYVAYTEAAKIEDLDVHPDILTVHGAVSRPAAQAMADGARRRSDADLAVSVTGYAGPGEGEIEEGLVYVALAESGEIAIVDEHHFGPLGRGAIRLAALAAAISLLERHIMG
ncbi:MAG TPA: nicotinamide-nucleotide amidohydrolase family protein [Brevundimonas sp.]|jgi:nicotinamide-nucleotide amidase|uniref:CinA family protein n=1 Tax=Brevundimonas sp. TaxID=1871086 RepID=UPI002E0F717A|nr:nicotinamide-nucleotide amidohydrolase family protein [Brevundimonas sp.]